MHGKNGRNHQTGSQRGPLWVSLHKRLKWGKLTVSSKMKRLSPVHTNSSVPGDPSVRHRTSSVRTISPLGNIPAIRELPSVNSYPPASIVGRCCCHLDPCRVRHIFQILSIIFAPRMALGKKEGLYWITMTRRCITSAFLAQISLSVCIRDMKRTCQVFHGKFLLYFLVS